MITEWHRTFQLGRQFQENCKLQRDSTTSWSGSIDKPTSANQDHIRRPAAKRFPRHAQIALQESNMNAMTPIRQPRYAYTILVWMASLPILVASPAMAGQARAADLFVSLQGSDTWSGRLPEPNATKTDGPLATIEHAQQLARQLKEIAGRATPIVVAIRGGTYFLARPIHFGPDDSGTAQVPITYQAYGQERPILSGGMKLDNWQVGSDGRWHLTLDEVKTGKWSFAQLFVNDQRRFRPRWPKHGYSKIDRELPPIEKDKRKWHDRFGYAGDDLRSRLDATAETWRSRSFADGPPCGSASNRSTRPSTSSCSPG